MTTGLDARARGLARRCAVTLVMIGLAWIPSGVLAEASRPRINPTSHELLFRLPIEFVQGGIHDTSRAGYVFNLQVLPGLAYSNLELNAVLAGGYTDPKWDFQLGLRASYAVFALFAGAVQFRLAAEGGYLLLATAPRGALGVMGDLSALVRLGLWVGRDFERDAYYWQLTLGTDIFTWGDPAGAIVKAGPMPDYP